MDDKFQVGTGQAHELALAFDRNGWTNADIKVLCGGDLLARLLPVVQGKAEVKCIEQVPPVAPVMPSKLPHVPDDEVFELTLDGDAFKNQPLEMVRRDGYIGTWKHNGPTVKGTQTRRFKWVEIGDCRNFVEVLEQLARHGKIPEGQWREAVKAKFQHDGVHRRGIADPSWVRPGSVAVFPYMGADGRSSFLWAAGDFRGRWSWLVDVSE